MLFVEVLRSWLWLREAAIKKETAALTENQGEAGVIFGFV
jgi:hypothetical protein